MENIVIGKKMKENDIIVKLEKKYKKKRKNSLFGSILMGISIIFLEISLLIFMGFIDIDIIFGIISLIIVSILMSIGIYLNNY
ncbi:hypothetical protein Maeo_1062 [Methanococcus aeolicus Nankai-3]|uniref:Uncharacterized protein n=3 Tax=Methanococcus aeolicus TaxID=42879 RepID=A6UVW8_META3|nr:hypothetical protein Maeo_1062 [Methanococcus aeolicus Nankai-3]